MALFTYEEVQGAAYQATHARSLTEFAANSAQVIKEAHEKTKDIREFDIFLSHSHNDRVLVLGLYRILTNAGYSVYVDWIKDSYLNRANVTRATIQLLKHRLRACDCLMYATTENHSKSKWMPWEAGFFDGYDGHVAILPVVNRGSSFVGQEYLASYSRAERSVSQTNKDSIIIYGFNDPPSFEFYTAWIARSLR
jgi:hypothetical protein